MAYAFALAGNQDKRNEILKSLDKEAIKEGENVCAHVCLHPAPMKKCRGAVGTWKDLLVLSLGHTEVSSCTALLRNQSSFYVITFCLMFSDSLA